jgi:glycine/D-amino acid oxidase-like deaminating enzyme
VVRAEKVLIATNGFTDNLWSDLRRTIVPVFSSIAATAPLLDDVARQIMPTRSVLYESGHITVYYRVDASNRLLMGGRGPMQWIRDPSAVAYLMRYAVRLWPTLRGVSWTHGWNSRLAMTADHYPHVHEPAPGALVYLGCNGRGVALATARAAIGTTADRGRGGRDRHAHHKPEANSLPRILARGREEHRALRPNS